MAALISQDGAQRTDGVTGCRGRPRGKDPRGRGRGSGRADDAVRGNSRTALGEPAVSGLAVASANGVLSQCLVIE
ncbi:hypothetical protein GCM10022247_66630 [Allokutzneria multivorans]|uniref:Uncharacterized protein n=1 Tax=Allokutzneria multivorans TaxID=1142134 RepID=A0ABP7TWZ8_9PSEU